MNKALQNMGLDKNGKNKPFAGQESLHHGHTQKVTASNDVEAMTRVAPSSTPQTVCQTTESQHPQHSTAISKAVENTLNDLAVVITAWPQLPDSMRKGIIAMVQSLTFSQD